MTNNLQYSFATNKRRQKRVTVEAAKHGLRSLKRLKYRKIPNIGSKISKSNQMQNHYMEFSATAPFYDLNGSMTSLFGSSAVFAQVCYSVLSISYIKVDL